jgi:hypothetical protein
LRYGTESVPNGRSWAKPWAALERPARRAARAALGEDLDHARRSLGTVQRARRRALDDLDVIDVRRIDVVQRARLEIGAAEPVRVVERGPVAAIALAPHPDAVDIDDRLIALSNADSTAQPDLRPLARHSARLHHAQPRRSALQQLIHVRWRVLDLVRDVDPRNRAPQLTHASHPSRTRDDDGVELQHARRELHVGGVHRVGDDRQPQRAELVADGEDAQIARADRDVHQHEPAVLTGPRAQVGPDDRHLGAGDGSVGLSGGDPPLYRPALRSDGPGARR